MAKTKCGHINRHSFGIDGKPDNLECTLDAGHPGPHSAPHHEIARAMSATLNSPDDDVFKAVYDENGEWLHYEGYPTRQWGDMAGIDAKDIKPSSPGQHLVNADEMFPELQKQKMDALEERINQLTALIEKQK